ncbi:MAG: non-canonical purine NTP diphosphatase [Bacteroidota bacterium]
MKIVFATHNPNKVREINAILGDAIEIVGLEEIGCTEEIPETQDTIPGNALQKARYVKEHFGLDCFAEDTGLEVDALNGEPGVHTAYYAGPARNADENMKKVLYSLETKTDRGAQFRTVIALILNGEEHTFEGIARGTIARKQRGEKGFGYDPIFMPEGYDKTFAELSGAEKNQISHRGKATALLQQFLAGREE